MGSSLAERPETRRALALLALLDAALLREAACWFGGGTAVALRCGEFRVSRDVDFLCASRDGYRRLRQRVHEKGLSGLFVAPVLVVRALRVDRYGIRGAVEVDGAPMKLELVSEGRIDLEGQDDPALPVGRLSDADLVAEKLLANEDRFLDDAALGRDAIDLVMLEQTLGGLPQAAWDKARGAYGPSVDDAWARGLQRLRDDRALLARGLEQMAVLPDARAVIAARLAGLAPREDAQG